jgi:hypothetical protein
MIGKFRGDVLSIGGFDKVRPILVTAKFYSLVEPNTYYDEVYKYGVSEMIEITTISVLSEVAK